LTGHQVEGQQSGQDAKDGQGHSKFVVVFQAWVKFSLTLLDFLRLPKTDSERQI
jgi:hypothetical protein